MDLPESAAERLLEGWPVARLATLGPDRRPHLVPIVFALAGGDLWSPIDGKPKKEGEPARVRNIRANPQVSLLLDAYEADWRRLWWLRVDGRAVVVEGRDPERDAELVPVVRALRAKYRQYQDLPLFRSEPVLLRIAVARVRGWCAGPAALEAASSACPASSRC